MIAVLPRKDGPSLTLTSTLSAWRKIEKEFCPPAPGPGLGALYLEHKLMRLRLDVCVAVVFECARAANERVEWADVERACVEVGFAKVHAVVEELFEALFKTRPLTATEAPVEETPGVPLVSGDSTPISS